MEKAPAGIHDAVDDNPLTKRETARALATALGRRWLVRLPWMVARVVGGDSAATAGRSQRVSNRRLREATGWMPAVPDACVGHRLLVGRPAR